MAFQLSPGVNVSEIDLTTIVPSVATSIGAFAGSFSWGPVGEIITVSDEVRLVDRFGKPNTNNYEYWFSAANFLAYSNNLKVVRAYGADTYTATANGSPNVLIKNDDDWEANWSGGANTYGEFASRYAGALGNSIKVSVADANTYSGWTYETQFTDTPGTSTYVSNAGGTLDEMHIIVIDEDGLISGTQGTVLEKYGFVSKASDAKDDSGNTNYYKNVIANKSKYIHWMSHADDGTNWGSAASGTTFANLTSNVTVSLTAGADGTISTANVVTSYDLFDNADSVDINLVVSGPANQTLADSLITMCETRKDCVVFLSPEKSDVVDNAGSETTDVKAYRDTLTSTSYAMMDSNWKYQYDKYNDVYRWVPCNGDIAGLAARTDLERDPWFSPAGPNRGIMIYMLKVLILLLHSKAKVHNYLAIKHYNLNHQRLIVSMFADCS
jgi:hypothetical protein